MADKRAGRPLSNSAFRARFRRMVFSAKSGARLPDARVLWVVDPIDGASCSPQRPAHLVPVAGDRRRRRAGHRRGLRPQPSGAVSALRAAAPGSTTLRSVAHPATTVKEGVMRASALASRHPGGLSAVSAGALLSDGGMFIRNGSGALMSAWAAAGWIDWLLRAAHEPVGRPAGGWC